MNLHHSIKCAGFVASFAVLTSCVEYHKLPEGYTGPTAVIHGTSKQLNMFKGEGYSVAKVDGKQVTSRTVATPRGAGPVLQVQDTEVTVMAKPSTLTLSAATVYAADGVALADSLVGGSRYVSGDISFTPKAGGIYRVTGNLSKGSESVWLIDEKSGKMVGPTVKKK